MWIIADAFTNAILLAGVVLFALIVFRHFHRSHVDQHRPPSDSQAGSSDAATPASRSGEAPIRYTQWQVEIHELATSMKSELDSKMRLLQLLIGQARVEATRLEQLLAEGEPRPTRAEPSAAPTERQASPDEPTRDA